MPGLASGMPQKNLLVMREVKRRRRNWPADPPRNRGRKKPDAQEREGQPELAGLEANDKNAGHDRDDGRDPHGDIEPKEVGARRALALAGGAPLQQPAASDQQPEAGADNRVHAE